MNGLLPQLVTRLIGIIKNILRVALLTTFAPLGLDNLEVNLSLRGVCLDLNAIDLAH